MRKSRYSAAQFAAHLPYEVAVLPHPLDSIRFGNDLHAGHIAESMRVASEVVGVDEVTPEAVRLDVRLSPEDRTRIVREAVRRRLTVSSYVRQTLLGRLDYEHDRDGQAIAASARETDARARALIEIIVEAIRNAVETLGRTVTDEDAKAEQQRLLRWYASAVEDHLRNGRGT